MRLAHRLLVFHLFALVLVPSLRAQQAYSPLSRGIDEVIGRASYQSAWWGIMVVNLRTGETVYEHNAHRSFIPASNTKLYTTAAALDQLGPDYRYHTRLFIDGPVQNGVLHGNLIVRGGGDPAIGGRFNNGDLTATFRTWADSLRAAGIFQIQGDIIGDDDVFDDVPLGYGWSWDDEPFWYAAEVSGLSFNDNCIDVTLTSQKVGQPARVTWAPMETDYVQITNSTLTISPDSPLKEGYHRPRNTNTVYLSSQIPAGQIDRESLSVSNPTKFFVHVLRDALVEAGLSVAGQTVDVDDIPIKPDYGNARLQRVATYTSPPLSDIISVVNKRSQNLYAEQVLKTLAAERPVAGDAYVRGSAEMGVAAAMETFVRAGIDTSQVQLVDGSGLSRMNLVTPATTTALLRYMWAHPNTKASTAFVASLPVGGVDGSLRYRYLDGPARGNVKAKTGTVSNASTLSGFLTSSDDTPYAFAIFTNHYLVKTAVIRNAQDEIVTLLAKASY